MQGRTSLQIVTQILLAREAKSCFIIEYVPHAGEDDYEEKKSPIEVPIGELANTVAAKIKETEFKAGPPIEIGILSKYLTSDGKEHHLVFADLENGVKADEIIIHKAIIVNSSSDGLHVFYREERATIAEAAAAILNHLEHTVDLKWLAAGLNQGYNILRLTANGPRFAKFGEPHE